MLKIDGLKKSYDNKVVALQGVDLEIEAGQILALLGANGAGKTTLVSIVAGLRRPDEGSIFINGLDALRYPNKVRPMLGIAPQELGFYPTVSVAANFRFFGELAGLSGKRLQTRTEQVASALSLTDLINRRSSELSGGQKRRLHTALALLHTPKLLFLDEPTVGADVRTRAEILEVVKKLAEEGCAVCYCTHYLPEVEQLGAEVAILEQGRIIKKAPLAELVAEYAVPAVELEFANGDAPALPGWSCDGARARILTADPTGTTAATLVNLGHEARRVRSIEIQQASLESAYLALTGKRIENNVTNETEKEVLNNAAA